MSLYDNFLAAISPTQALKRRMAQDRLRGYDAAGQGRRNKNRILRDGTANSLSQRDLKILIARHREVTRNNGYASRAIKSITNNTVGVGIIPSFTGKGKETASKLWEYWADSTKCDFDGNTNFYGLQSLCMRSVADSGGVLIMRRRSKDTNVPLELQLMDVDYLDTNRDQQQLNNGGCIIGGIEYDGRGKKVGYWLYEADPSTLRGLRSRLVPASDVLHIYEMLRPGQTRGIPFGATSLLRLGDFDEYEDAELMRQKIAACFSVFITKNSMDTSGKDAESGEYREKVEPGIIEHLLPGEEVKFASPPGTENYDTFSKKIMQGSAAGYDVTYEAMTGDLGNVNFSSARIGRIEVKQQYLVWQYHVLIPQLCERVFEWFMDALTVALRTTKNTDVKASWTPPVMEMIDPWKETNALQAQVRNGFIPPQEAIKGMGWDPEKVIKQIAEWNKLLDQNKIILDSDGRQDVVKPEGNQGSGTVKAKS